MKPVLTEIEIAALCGGKRAARRVAETHKIHDPFLNKEVEISSRLTDRLRGRYASGPTMKNGEPEFGWRQFETPPIQHEAAEIERLHKALTQAEASFEFIRLKLIRHLEEPERSSFWRAVEARDAIRALALPRPNGGTR